MPYSDILLSTTWTANDLASLINNIMSASHDAAWTTWTPTLGAGGAMTFTGTSIRIASFIRIGKLVMCRLRVDGNLGGTANAVVTATLPVTPVTVAGGFTSWLAGAVFNNGIIESATIELVPATNLGNWRRYNGAVYTLATAAIAGTFLYEGV